MKHAVIVLIAIYFQHFKMVTTTSFTTIIFMIVINFLLVHAKNDYHNCYIKHCSVSNNSLCWSRDAEYFNLYTKTCKILYFKHEVYELRGEYRINDHNNFTVIGNGATIICYNYKSLLLFSNINILQVSNITLTNCNITIASFSISELSSFLLCNVTYVEFSNIMFNRHVVFVVNFERVSLLNVDCKNSISMSNNDIVSTHTSSLILCSINTQNDVNIFNFTTNMLALLNNEASFKSSWSVEITNQGYQDSSVVSDGTQNKELLRARSRKNKLTVLSSMCYCGDSHNICSINITIDQNIYPSQNLVLPLKSALQHKEVIYVASKGSQNNATNCKIPSILSEVNFIYENCTELTYTIISYSPGWCLLYLRTLTDDTLYTYNITLKSCPVGLVLHDGLCVCNPKLEANNIQCDVNAGMFITPPLSWIAKVGNTSDMMYSLLCYRDYCSKAFSTVNLSEPQQQCLTNRDGILCGKCAKGYSAVFATSSCRKCSNIWLLLIPACAVAGVLLMLFLFKLNLTVVDGDIHGFLLYANMLSVYSVVIFPPQHHSMYLPIMMSNLDLGVEVCFYDGMTDYAKLWLQFIFPIYVILLVVGLSYASRYFTSIEKLTRKRVIPVIATLHWLICNKMLLTVTEGLSYRKVSHLNSDTKQFYWAVDTSIPFMGPEYMVQLVFCSMIVLLILLPTTILLLVPKYFLRYKLVHKFLKPFLDAYLAPFRDDCYYFMGIELIMRVFVYVLHSEKPDYTTGIMIAIVLIYFVYLSYFQPFKSSINGLLYSVYWCILGCVATLILCFFPKMPKSYIITFDILVYFGFLLFLGIVVAHFCKYILHKDLSCNIIEKCKLFIMTPVLNPVQDPEAVATSYEKFQDELLAIDPEF